MPPRFFPYLVFNPRGHEEEIKNSSTNQHEGWEAEAFICYILGYRITPFELFFCSGDKFATDLVLSNVDSWGQLSI